MAKSRSEYSRFPSRYGGGNVTAGQYITECLCCLIARQQKKELGDQFWQKAPWDKVFRTQIPAAMELLSRYHPNVIIASLRDRRCWKIQSLRAKWLLEPILKEKDAEYRIQITAPQVIMEKTSTIQQPRHSVVKKKSLITLLKEVENER